MRNKVWICCMMASLTLVSTASAQRGGGGGRGGPGGGMFGGAGGGLFRVAANEAVQTEIGLTGDNATKVKTINEDYRAAIGEAMRSAGGGGGGGGGFQDLTQEERDKRFEKMAEIGKATADKFLPKLKEALSADQFTRVQQINWQLQDTAAYSDAEVIKSLQISSEQQAKIKEVTAALDKKNREAFQGRGGGGGGGGREEFQARMEEMRKERKTKVNEVLTKEQLDKFEALKGKAFAQLSELQQFGGRGGPGGRGDGGGGGGAPRGKRPQPKAE